MVSGNRLFSSARTQGSLSLPPPSLPGPSLWGSCCNGALAVGFQSTPSIWRAQKDSRGHLFRSASHRKVHQHVRRQGASRARSLFLSQIHSVTWESVGPWEEHELWFAKKKCICRVSQPWLQTATQREQMRTNAIQRSNQLHEGGCRNSLGCGCESISQGSEITKSCFLLVH